MKEIFLFHKTHLSFYPLRIRHHNNDAADRNLCVVGVGVLWLLLYCVCAHLFTLRHSDTDRYVTPVSLLSGELGACPGPSCFLLTNSC